ncbi:PPOX class F420-dependent oxidoreductase [Actinokineospora spheciospongiae]|uniref:PPOX class F420-dependent oxidoreductase n=1 Tax=Actinokineospora spheciospongiae TaxID=909613 RepID=UPI000D71899F|nr:PPOX class F420-dependent oxidoreductase [Actinokineospora spheciospongiae]PWW65847.1 PPOX class probable F420-dependent enzyme [Actinokineospora spheciospongiae]
MAALSETARKIFDDHNYVVLATINPDGSPQTSVLWAKRDGDDILLSTVRGRKKARNLERDPRVSLTAYDRENPYSYVEIRGSVSLTDEGGRELIEELSQAYRGESYPEEPEGTVRVVVRLTPDRITGNSA